MDRVRECIIVFVAILMLSVFGHTHVNNVPESDVNWTSDIYRRTMQEAANYMNQLATTVASLINVASNIYIQFNELKSSLDNPIAIGLNSSKIFATSIPANLSRQCQRHLYIDNESQELNRWSQQMLDSFGKPPSGIKQGNWYWLGSFWQCLNVKILDEHWNGGTVVGVGEYCLVRIYLDGSGQLSSEGNVQMNNVIDISSLKLGMCFPSVCSMVDKRILIRHYSRNSGVEAIVDQSLCQTAERKMDSVSLMLTVIVLIPVVLVIMATILDYKKLRSNTPLKKQQLNLSNKDASFRFCYVFSMRSSYASLFSSSRPGECETLGFLYGIRALRVTRMIASHTFLALVVASPLKNQMEAFEFAVSPLEKYINLPFLFMSIVFYLSGFCLSYVTFSGLYKTGTTFSIFGSYFKRYTKMTVPYLYVMSFIMGPLAYLTQGPVWPRVNYAAIVCRKHWWKKITYTQHIVGVDPDTCVMGEWSLSIEMQLSLLATIIVWLLIRKPKQGIFCIVVMITTSMISIALMITTKNYQIYQSISTQLYGSLSKQNWAVFADRHSLYRASSCGFGLLMGYSFVHLRRSQFRLTQLVSLCGWISVALCGIIITLPSNLYIEGKVMPVYLQIAYGTFGCLLWCTALTWIIIHCTYVPHGYLNSFLSSKFLLLIGKLTYGIYLVHGSVLTWHFYSVTEPITFSGLQFFSDFIIVCGLCFFGALLTYFVVESPTDRIIKILTVKQQIILKSMDKMK